MSNTGKDENKSPSSMCMHFSLKYSYPGSNSSGFINTAILNGSMFQYTVDIEHLVKNAFFENFPEESTNQNNVSTLDATLNMTHRRVTN
jgi:hypothetical protein